MINDHNITELADYRPKMTLHGEVSGKTHTMTADDLERILNGQTRIEDIDPDFFRDVIFSWIQRIAAEPLPEGPGAA